MMGKGHPTPLSGRLVWLAAGLVVVGVIFQWIVDPAQPRTVAEAMALGSWALLPLPFALVAAIIVSRQPRNVIGWLLFLPALITVLDPLFAMVIGAGDGPPPEVGFLVLLTLWAASISWMGLIFPLFHLLLVFPTGRLLSDRWNWLVRLELSMIVFLLVTGALARELGHGSWTVPNPIGFIPEGFFGVVFNAIWTAGLLILAIAGVVGMAVRYRRAGAAERQQLKWLLSAVALFVATFSAVAMGPASGDALDPLVDLAFALSIWVIPVAIGIAVLRYRLFEIDRLVSRTVTYLVVMGLLALAYAGLVVGLRELFPVEGDLPVAVSTLVVALAFLPLVRRVQRVVDRRFFRSRYDAALVVARVAEELRGSLDLDEVTARAKTVVSEVFSPETLAIWVVEHGR